ncbi:galactokinase [Pedobacter cryophilus]|uniref:Galactokinase n=1 Tax=Pedobacter cryophilus TaxID=2571271 RepID=A0A4U1BZ54_9SPHI|nr:galactokinase [Pedobacter cryophilus]TKB97778.1 galactokinase [Pedobacter cryophilus]
MRDPQHLVKSIFLKTFNEEPLIVRSPGRVNLIGEHTDYNMGFVLPAAINKAAYIAIKEREDDTIFIVAADLEESFSTTVSHCNYSDKGWPNYVICIVEQLLKINKKIGGFNAVISGDVPLGAGMSSSAALECATVFALDHIFELGLDKMQMVKLAQKAENEFVGVNCGIMDQFASVFGKKGHVVKLDCRSLEYEYVPFELEGIKIVLFDSMVKHSLASSEYNVRTSQCGEGVSIIQQKYPDVKTLRDATIAMVEECLATESTDIYHRCKYVVEENNRLLAACEDLSQNKIEDFGQKMYETHAGLSELYEVSCPELDFIVSCTKKEENILGARMMGGGFGGCVITLVKEDDLDNVVKRIKDAYWNKMNIGMNVYITQIENGTHIVN